MSNEDQILAMCVDRISSYLGVKMFITKGGPSIVDPASIIKFYVAFRDPSGHALGFKITNAGDISPLDMNKTG